MFREEDEKLARWERGAFEDFENECAIVRLHAERDQRLCDSQREIRAFFVIQVIDVESSVGGDQVRRPLAETMDECIARRALEEIAAMRQASHESNVIGVAKRYGIRGFQRHRKRD